MWIEKTKTGKYQYRERYMDPLTHKYRNISITLDNKSRTTQKIAQRALDEKIREKVQKAYAPKSPTFKELRDLYVDWQYKNLKEQSALNVERKLNKIAELIGDDTMADDLTAWYVKTRLETEKPCTYNDRVKTFKAMIRWAYRNELVQDISYLDRIERKKDTPIRIKNEDKFLEHDEIKVLLPAMKAYHWKLLTEFLILSGMRIGEVMDLDVKDVDIEKREIDINSSYSMHIGLSSSVKTDSSYRVIYIQDELLRCVKKINKYRHDVERKNSCIASFFFPYVNGGRIRYDAYRKYLKETTEKVIGRPLTPHALRHTHTALLATAGIPLSAISRRLGHQNSRITEEVYMHVTARMKNKENEQLKKVKLL